MNTSMTTQSGPRSWRRLLLNRYTVAAFVAGTALAAAVGASAFGMGCAHARIFDGTHSAAEVSAQVDHMLKHFYVEIDATPAQQAQIDPLIKQAVNDLMPLHSQLSALHARGMQAMQQTSVDRGSLEAVRAEHLQLADQASKRLTQLIADVGDVLTVPQRKALAEHLEHMHGR
jgi:periplasmic protein CpxP/Spy